MPERSAMCNADAPSRSVEFGLAPCSSRKIANSSCPLSVAINKAFSPPGAASFGSAPLSIISRADAKSPRRAANDKGVNPAFDFAWTSAPAPMRIPTTAGWLSSNAHMSAVCPLFGSFALTSAPRASRDFTASGLPVRAHRINAVSPARNTAFGLAAALNNVSTIAPFALLQASHNGVTPYSFPKLAFAPALINRSATSRSPQCAAQDNALVPSPCSVFTSTRCFSSVRTASLSLFLTAFTNRTSLAAIGAASSNSETIPPVTARVIRVVLLCITIHTCALFKHLYISNLIGACADPPNPVRMTAIDFNASDIRIGDRVRKFEKCIVGWIESANLVRIDFAEPDEIVILVDIDGIRPRVGGGRRVLSNGAGPIIHLHEFA